MKVLTMDETKCTGERLLTGYFDRFTIEHLHRYGLACRLAHNKKVLDIASGDGYGSNLLASIAHSVVGVDIDSFVIEHAKNKYPKSNLRFVTGSADAIPVESATIDLVVSFETLEHHDKHEQMYAEIKRVLRPDGVLIISTPDRRFCSDATDHRNAYHVKELYFEEFLELNQRHFKNLNIYSQKTVFGSLIVKHGNKDEFSMLRGDHSNIEPLTSFEDPTYHLCVASNSSLESLGTSFFDGDRVLKDMEAAFSESWKTEHLAARADAHLREIGNLKNSLSFRLGHALLTPIRLLLKRKE